MAVAWGVAVGFGAELEVDVACGVGVTDIPGGGVAVGFGAELEVDVACGVGVTDIPGGGVFDELVGGIDPLDPDPELQPLNAPVAVRSTQSVRTRSLSAIKLLSNA